MPAAVVSQFAQGSGSATNSLTGVGNLDQQLAQQLPAQARPLIPKITAGDPGRPLGIDRRA